MLVVCVGAVEQKSKHHFLNRKLTHFKIQSLTVHVDSVQFSKKRSQKVDSAFAEAMGVSVEVIKAMEQKLDPSQMPQARQGFWSF